MGKWRSALRRSARSLAPVVIRGRSEVRFSGMVERLAGRGRTARLIISPVAADRLIATPGPYSIYCDVDQWKADATEIEAIDERSIAVPVDSIQLEAIPAREHRHRVSEDHPLLFVGPTHFGELHVLPIVDLAREHVSIEGGIALEDGAVLDPVEIVGDRGLLRRASARLVGVVPWLGVGGEERFRMRFVLGPSSGKADAYDLLDDPRRIHRVLELAQLLDVDLRIDGLPTALRSLESAQLSTIERIDGEGGSSLEFELFGVRYTGVIRAISPHTFSFPLVLRRHRRRAQPRIEVESRKLQLTFRNPLTSQYRRERVLDLSLGGIAFRNDDPAQVVWTDLPLENAELQWKGNRIHLGELIVRSTGTDVCHAEIRSPPKELVDMLIRIRRPELSASGHDFDRIWKLFEETSLLAPFMRERALDRLDELRSSWHSVYGRESDVARAFTQMMGERAVATVGMVYAWDGVWLGQHMAALRGERRCSPGTLFNIYLDYVLLRSDCRFMAFFTSVNNQRMNEIHQRFHALTGTSEAFGCVHLRVYKQGALGPTTDAATVVRALKPADEPLIGRAATRSLGAIPAQALAFGAGRFRIPEAKARFRLHGLQRSRALDVITIDQIPRMLLAHEECEPGANLTGLLNATWLLPLHLVREGSSLRHDVRALTRAAERTRELERELIITTAEIPPECMRQAGYAPLVDANLYVINRAGLRRYAQYLAESFGESNALRTRRDTA